MNDTLTPPAMVLLTEAQLRAVVRSEVAAVVSQLGPVEPATVTVRQAAERTGIGIHAIERTLARHPELRLRVGTRVLIHWPQYRQWLGRQPQIESDDRPRKPTPRRVRP